MAATPKHLQRLNQVGYGFIGAGSFLLLSWVNPLDWSPAAGVTLAVLLAAAALYRQASRGQRHFRPDATAARRAEQSAEPGDSNLDI